MSVERLHIIRTTQVYRQGTSRIFPVALRPTETLELFYQERASAHALAVCRRANAADRRRSERQHKNGMRKSAKKK